MRYPLITQETELMEMENSHHYEEEKMIKVLYEASYKGCVSTLNPLIQQDPLILYRINSRTTFIETTLHISASLGHLQFTKALITHKPKLVLELDSFRSTALHLASAEGHIDIVKELLLACEQPCLVSDQEGRIPLHIVVIRGRLEVVAELIRVKPESLSILHKGRTVFHLCVTHNHLEILKALVDSGIDTCDELLNLRDLDGRNTILHSAIMLKQVETVGYLMSIPKIREASDLKNDMGFTASDIFRRIPKDLKILEIHDILMNASLIKSEKKETDIPQAPTTTDIVVHESVGPPKKCWKNMFKSLGKWFNHNGDWLEEMRGNLSLVATVISTMTFQVVMNPPGSFIQQGISNSNNTTFIRSENRNSTGPLDCLEKDDDYPMGNACPGQSILASRDSDSFHYFIICNTIAFVASLGVTLLLVSGLPLKNKFVMCMLSMGMAFTLTALVLTYFWAFLMITPNKFWDDSINRKVFQMALTTWWVMLALAGAYTLLTFVIWFVRKCMRIVKPFGRLCQRNRNGNGCFFI